MPVILPRRSSATNSSFNVMPTSSSVSSTELSGTSSYLDRGNSQSKASPTSYSSSYGLLNSYTPRTTSTYRSSGSSSATSYSTGGLSKYSSYRSPSTYLSWNNDSTLSSRYGLKTKSNIPKDSLRNHDGNHETSKSSNSGSDCCKSNNRLSSSYSSSSLARLVATSGLDLYEKYSPAHYKPKCELLRSRTSVSETASSAADNKIADESMRNASEAIKSNTRYSYLNSKQNTNDDVIVSAISKRTSKPIDKSLHSSSSSSSLKCSFNNTTNTNTSSNIKKSPSDDAIPTYTVYRNRMRRPAASTNADDDDENALKNGLASENNSYSNSSSTDRITETRNHLKDLNLSSESSLRSAGDDKETTYEPNVAATITITNCSNGSGRNASDAITPAASNLEAISSVANGCKTRNSMNLRSGLPPPSPTSSRYRDRDTNKTITYDFPHTSASQSLDIKSQGLCGLRNIGNTCFMNSVIQCLSNTSELIKFLRTLNGVKSAVTRDQQILYEFAKLIREMWTPNVHSVTPLDLKRAFATKHRTFSDYNQQDAQEFLRFFLDSLHGALNSGIKGGDHLKIDENLSDNKKADLTWEWYTRHENSLIRDLFVGQLKSTLKCTVCGNTSVTFDPFWDLSVSLPSSARCKLDACLDLFIREEILDGDEMPNCSKCNTRRRCTKSFSIQRFPKYLVIHLKRFSEARWSKLSNIVEFPTGERELNMGPYGANHNSNAYYSLYGVSNHMGSTAGGHYVALCKHPISKAWHEFNDNIVSPELSESSLISSSAYILFYERA